MPRKIPKGFVRLATGLVTTGDLIWKRNGWAEASSWDIGNRVETFAGVARRKA